MKSTFIFILLILMVFNLKSQNVINSSNVLIGGVDDGVKLINAYVKPLNKSLMAGMNNNVFHKAYNNTKNKRLSFSIKTSFISIPDSDLSFDINSLGLKELEVIGSNSVSPTVFGHINNVKLRTKSKTVDLSTFPPGLKPLYTLNTPSGIAFDKMIFSNLQLAYNFNQATISVSVIPFIKVPNSDFRITQVGLDWQLDLSKLLSLDKTPFNISVLAGYYFFKGNSPLEVNPNHVNLNVNILGRDSGPYDNQSFTTFYTTASFSTFASYNFDALTLFGGIGYNISRSNIKIEGIFPIYYESQGGNIGVNLSDIEDPMNHSTQFSKFKMELGARIDVKRYYFQSNYVFGNYGGFGLELGLLF